MRSPIIDLINSESPKEKIEGLERLELLGDPYQEGSSPIKFIKIFHELGGEEFLCELYEKYPDRAKILDGKFEFYKTNSNPFHNMSAYLACLEDGEEEVD